MPMNSKWEQCIEAIRRRTDFVPEIAVVLGSGLGSIADSIEQECAVSYSEIPGFPVSTVAGHKGRFVFGRVREVPVVLMQGRVHYYEGYDMQEVVLPIRLMAGLGLKRMILTNAAGGICTDYQVGDFMLITDQISSLVPSPLRGPNPDSLGPRFPDMSAVYDAGMSEAIRKSAVKLGIDLREGVYLQTGGPQYETPAEIRMMRAWGADAVGMSTACEAIAARHMGIRLAGISCITNMAAGVSSNPLSHAEVEQIGREKAGLFQRLLEESMEAIWNA